MAFQQSYVARRKAARPSDLADWGPRVMFVLFFFPSVIYIACGPEFSAFGQADFYYRVFQTLWAAASLTLAIWMTQRFGLRLSGIAKFVALFLMISAVLQYASQAFQYRPEYGFESFQTTLLFLATFLGLDLLARRHTFGRFAEDASWFAAATLLASVIHVMFFAERVYGRAFYFGQHPNLGGEIVFGAAALVAFNNRAWLRFLCYAFAIVTLLELQSRAAVLAVALMVVITEIPRRMEVFRIGLAAAFAATALMCTAMLVSPSLGQRVSNFVKEDELMVSNPYRGAGTGLVGRADTWVMAYHRVIERPLTGSGLNLSGKTILGDPVHNGYIKNLADFGVPGILLDILLLAAIPMAFRVDPRRGALVLACNFVYFFNARNVNLNIFPLVLWIAILPWRTPTSPRASGDEPADA